jgi:predicted ferric reductase
LKVYIKRLGDFTAELGNLKVGDKTIIEGPYGRFNYTETKSNLDQIWIAGGIGITPFIGMVQDLEKHMKHKVTLYYAVNVEDELIALDLFKSIEKANDKFKVITWIKDKNGYLDAKVIKEHSGSVKNKSFYICGPPGMKSALAAGLMDSGVKQKNIIMEDFSFR